MSECPCTDRQSSCQLMYFLLQATFLWPCLQLWGQGCTLSPFPFNASDSLLQWILLKQCLEQQSPTWFFGCTKSHKLPQNVFFFYYQYKILQHDKQASILSSVFIHPLCYHLPFKHKKYSQSAYPCATISTWYRTVALPLKNILLEETCDSTWINIKLFFCILQAS